jgi:hypothetical protein
VLRSRDQNIPSLMAFDYHFAESAPTTEAKAHRNKASKEFHCSKQSQNFEGWGHRVGFGVASQIHIRTFLIKLNPAPRASVVRLP